MEQMLARSWRMPPCDKITAPEPQHARGCSSRPPHAAQRWPASLHCAEAAAVSSLSGAIASHSSMPFLREARATCWIFSASSGKCALVSRSGTRGTL
eukprot:CAMPEP_0115833114 /NCGR_PEP_ID=MMETSP0287-20121206/3006_1 /TAXON_ID=412157 /ORGANISM="Chrysochromulina rotalis, Strain UIO044" /LENGTH=96 /DNA_ID=CAMNT_0003286519 /DNA_START=1 /DNA_END=287 /DNA_ORIENTATION=+